MDFFTDNVAAVAANDLAVLGLSLLFSWLVTTRPGRVLKDLATEIKDKADSPEVGILKGILK